MILLTGASGFLGNIIRSHFLNETLTLGRSKEMDIVCDISVGQPELPIIDLVIHAAGKAHVIPKTDEECLEFNAINVVGTRNLLSAIELTKSLPKSFVFISSVSVYGLESGENIKESNSLMASEPYGISKIQAEKLVIDWCEKHNVICTILRLPLLAGPNPPGNLGGMINGIKKGYYFNISGGMARKSIVLADDVAKIISVAAEKGGIYNLSDGCHPSFKELSEDISSQLRKSNPLNMPMWIAKFLAKLGDFLGDGFPINSKKLKKIISPLTFNDSKARENLGWKPRSVLRNFKIE